MFLIAFGSIIVLWMGMKERGRCGNVNHRGKMDASHVTLFPDNVRSKKKGLINQIPCHMLCDTRSREAPHIVAETTQK